MHVVPAQASSTLVTQLTQLVRELPQIQMSIFVLGNGGDCVNRIAEAGIPANTIVSRWRQDPFAFWKLFQHSRQLSPDVTHTWKDEHESLPYRSLLVGTNDCCVVSSQRHAKTKRYEVVRPGIPVASGRSDQSRSKLLERLNLNENSRLIATVGDLHPRACLKELMWAVSILRDIRDDIQLLVIGNGPGHWRFERYARQIGHQANIHFLCSAVDEASLISNCDCYWTASQEDVSMPGTLAAMAAAVPIIAVDTPANRELIQHGESGFLVESGNSATFARYTEKLLNDRSLAALVGGTARRFVADEYPLHQMVGCYRKLYRKMTA